jgi:hypothetical protein
MANDPSNYISQALKCQTMDVVAACHAKLHNICTVNINENKETEYWKFHKALYGLKQAGHEWFQILKRILEESGLRQCIGHEGCHIRTLETLLGTHVNDHQGIAPSEQILDEIEQKIERHVELEKYRNPQKCLGWKLNG